MKILEERTQKYTKTEITFECDGLKYKKVIIRDSYDEIDDSYYLDYNNEKVSGDKIIRLQNRLNNLKRFNEKRESIVQYIKKNGFENRSNHEAYRDLYEACGCFYEVDRELAQIVACDLYRVKIGDYINFHDKSAKVKEIEVIADQIVLKTNKFKVKVWENYINSSNESARRTVNKIYNACTGIYFDGKYYSKNQVTATDSAIRIYDGNKEVFSSFCSFLTLGVLKEDRVSFNVFTNTSHTIDFLLDY